MKSKLKEELSASDKQLIRKIIRREIANVFFDLYIKRTVWKQP
jgi:hypothetical protein